MSLSDIKTTLIGDMIFVMCKRDNESVYMYFPIKILSYASLCKYDTYEECLYNKASNKPYVYCSRYHHGNTLYNLIEKLESVGNPLFYNRIFPIDSDIPLSNVIDILHNIHQQSIKKHYNI